MSSLLEFLRDDSGATVIEYGLIAALISIVIIASLFVMGAELVAIFAEVKDGFATR